MTLPVLLWACIAAITPPLFAADVRWLCLPNRLLLAGALGVVVVTAVGGIVAPALGDVGLPWARAAPFTAGVAALMGFGGLRMLGAIGMGDVKLAGLLAACLGFLPSADVVPALELALVVAGAAAGATALALLSTMTARTQSIPCGPFLLAGFWFALLQS
ncbi:MAG: Leader peptidase (Prepilin peptidase) / N-methyltransferase [Subtercola sp.]|nr:Leader peptidase (Prepilin peptidase) / N-methyltransferase [Subtercola sp.]